MRPAKPSPDFPLFPHANGQWAKKIRGKTTYFGPWSDWQAALRKFHLMTNGKRNTLKTTVERYLESRTRLQQSGEITSRHLRDMERVLNRMVKTIGGGKTVPNLSSNDWGKWRAQLAKTNGARSLTNHLIKVRAFLNWLVMEEIIDKFPRTDALKKPTPAQLRRERAARGSRMFEPEEIHELLRVRVPQFPAMVLLGLNCGLGPADLVGLHTSHLVDGWLIYPRSKTGVARRTPLWPETIEALTGLGSDGLIFTASGSWITHKFTQQCRYIGIWKPGRGIDSLRHVCQTIGEEAGDHVAIGAILGHAPRGDDMSAVYRERVSDERLQRVVDHIRGWVFGLVTVPIFDPVDQSVPATVTQ